MQAKAENSALSTQHSALIALILLHLMIALPLAYLLNIWSDEASTLYTTEHGIFQAFQNALADEKQAPLYFWLLSLWRTLNDSIFFARLFSVICSCLAIKIFSDLAGNLYQRKTAIFATAFFAIHPYLIWASLEIRVYSAVILISALLLKLFYEGYLESGETKSRRKTRVFYLLISIVALYTNYYLGFLLAANFGALLVTKKWHAARTYFLQMLVAGIAFLPLIWVIKSQFSANTSGFRYDRSVVEGLQILWNVFLTFTLPTEIFTPEEVSGTSVVRLWIMRFAVLAGAVLLLKYRRKLNEDFRAFGTICAAICLFLLAAYFLLGPVYTAVRHTAVLFPPLILFVFLCLEIILISPKFESEGKVRQPRGSFLIEAFLITLVVFSFIYSIYTLYPNAAKRGDWARVGNFLEQNEKPDQPILVFWTFDALALPYHYSGINRIYPDEKFFDWELEDKAGSENSRKRETNFIIAKIPADSREIWVLTDSSCNNSQMCQPLENFLQANYTVVETKDFYQERLRLLRKK